MNKNNKASIDVLISNKIKKSWTEGLCKVAMCNSKDQQHSD